MTKILPKVNKSNVCLFTLIQIPWLKKQRRGPYYINATNLLSLIFIFGKDHQCLPCTYKLHPIFQGNIANNAGRRLEDLPT